MTMKRLKNWPHNFGEKHMVNAIELYSEVKNCHLDIPCRLSIKNALKMLDGKKIKVTIEERKKTRSIRQNSFYFGVIVPLVTNFLNEYGANIDGDEAHEFLKQEVMKLRREFVTPDGEVRYITGSTTKLTTAEWELQMDKIRAWAANVSLILPFPNEEKIHEEN